MDSSRLRTGEIVAGIGGFALFVFLFFDWYSRGLEAFGGGSVTGWDALTDVTGFLIILSGVSGMALAGLAASGQRVNIPVRRGAITATLGVLAVLLILWRMVAGSPTLKIGIFLGLGAAIMIAVGALMALQEDGFKPLVPVPGGRTRAAAASPPPATPAPAAAAPAAASASSGGGSSTATTTEKATTKKPPAKKSTSSRSSASKSKSTSSRSTSSKSRSAASKSRSSSSKGRSSSRSGAKKSSGSRSSGARKRSSGGRK